MEESHRDSRCPALRLTGRPLHRLAGSRQRRVATPGQSPGPISPSGPRCASTSASGPWAFRGWRSSAAPFGPFEIPAGRFGGPREGASRIYACLPSGWGRLTVRHLLAALGPIDVHLGAADSQHAATLPS